MNDAVATQGPPTVAHARRSIRVFAAQTIFAGLLLAAVAGTLWTITRDQTRLAEAPAVLAGMYVQDVTTGPAALSSMERLHGTGIGLKDGWIATYQHGGVLWVGEAESAEAAAELADRMTEGIENGNPMFRHLGTETVGVVTAHKVTDGATLHYYYARGDKVFWISAPADSGQEFVEEAIAALS
jgi:hypothetical protein